MSIAAAGFGKGACMSHDLDLDAYFARIGYDGPREPTLEVLRALHLSHAQAIPFENLDPLLGRRVKLAPEALTEKLVRGGRGGYCFEQNGLFLAALRALGFDAIGLQARVVWQGPGLTPRTHMLIRVRLPEGDHIADVGFGGMSLTAPLRLEAGEAQETPHGLFRLMAVGSEFQLETQLPERWAPMYRFDLTEAFAPDYEVANWYVSTYPESIFVANLMAARVLPGRRLALSNGVMTVYREGGMDRLTIETPEALAKVLREEFGIALPEGVEAGLAKVLQPPS
jgi:N-hydroxyarylamine O-acetyltransferase